MTHRSHSLKSPCKGCPFSRASVAGQRGGNDATVYIGQAYGPFLLSCHQDEDYDQSLGGQPEIAQCAGAAIFRANVGVADLLDKARCVLKSGELISLHALPADKEKVFSNPAQLLAHHRNISLEEADNVMKETTPQDLLSIEIGKLKRHMILPRPKPGDLK